MAPNVEEIAEILNLMREENEQNISEFGKSLTGINHKLEMIADDSEAADTLKIYISELKKTVEERHSKTLVKFDNIEESLRDISDSQNSSGIIYADMLGRLENISGNVSNVREEFKQATETDIENITKIRDGINLVSDELYGIKNDLTENAKTNFANLKNIINELREKISDDISKQEEIFSSLASDDEKIGALQDLIQDINSVNSVISTNTDIIKSHVEENISEIKDFIRQTNNEIYDEQVKTENKISESIENYEILNKFFETSVSELNSQLQEVFEKISTLATYEQNDEIRNIISNLLSSYDISIKAISNLNKLNEELSNVLSSFMDNIVKKDDIVPIVEKLSEIHNIDYSEDFEQVLTKIESFDKNLSGVSNELSDVLFDIKSVVQNFPYENSKAINDRFEILAQNLTDILTLDDLDDLKSDVINNCNSILNKISVLKDDILDYFKENTNNVDLSKINDELHSLNLGIQYLKDNSTDKPDEILDKILSEFHSAIQEIEGKIITSSTTDLDNIKSEISNVVEEISAVKSVFHNGHDECLDKISSGFDSIQLSFENIIESFNSLNTDFREISSSNSSQIISNVKELSEKIDDLKFEISNNSNDYLETNILEKITNLKEQMVESFNEYSNQEEFSKINKDLSELSEDIKYLKNYSDIKPDQVLEKIFIELHSVLSEVEVRLNSGMVSGFEDVKTTFSNAVNEIEELKTIFSQNNTESSDRISSGFDSIQLSFENIIGAFNSLNSDFKEISTSNSTKIISNLEDLCEKINDLKTGIASLSFDYVETNISEKITNLEEKILEFLNTNSDNEEFTKVFEKFSELSAEIQLLKDFAEIKPDEILEKISKEFNSLLVETENRLNADISLNLDDMKLTVSNAVFEINEVKTVLGKNNESNLSKMIEGFDGIQLSFENIISAFNSLSGDFKDISSSNSSQILSDMKELSDKIENLHTEISNTSYDYIETNITEKISDLKDEILLSLNTNTYNEEFSKISDELSSLTDDVKYLKNYSETKPDEILEKALEGIQTSISNIKEQITSDISLNMDDVKLTVANAVREIDDIKFVIAQNSDENSEKISLGFDGIQLSFENIISAFNSLSGDFKEISSTNSMKILSDLRELSEKTEDLKGEIEQVTSDYFEKLVNSFSEISKKLDTLTDNDSIKTTLFSLRDEVVSMVAEIQLSKENFIAEIKENGLHSANELRNLSDNVGELHVCVEDASSSIKDYIKELNDAMSFANTAATNNITEKLMDIETSLAEGSQNFEEKISNLQTKLSEFTEISETEKNNFDTKIQASLDEINSIKEEFIKLNEGLEVYKSSSDESFEQAASIIDSGIENVIFNINELNTSLINGIDSSVKDNMSEITNNFSNLVDIISNIKDEFSGANLNLIENIEEKTLSLKEEISLVNTDLSNAFQCKAEEISRAIQIVQTALDDFTDLNIEKIFENIKSQIEASLINFTSEINGEISQNADIITKLEIAYRDAMGKISSIEEYVGNKIQSNIELLDVAVNNNIRDIKTAIDEKFDLQTESFKNEFAEKFNRIIELQDQIIDKNDSIPVQINEKIDNLSQKMENLSTEKDNSELFDEFDRITEMIDILNSKINVIATDDNIEKLSSDINYNITELNDNFNDLNKKIDLLSQKDNSPKIIEEFDKVSEVLHALNTKVDVIAMAEDNLNLFDEIDNIKDLIFEQRKYFEEASDEKTAAIDKYLRDVLEKLDNVDLERNAADIKESIMSALISSVNQISFVEESEDIKDFVEEKTEQISKNLIEVQNQLKQIATSDDDFNYSYTLQDVESDIAKLRLALLNMSDYESLSGDIKKIITSVEGLELSLTQDQVVDLKNDIEKLNEDIISISSRTNKLLISSDESYKSLNDGFNNFSELISKLENRINELDDSSVSERLERKIDSIHSMSLDAANYDKTFNQVMTYLGEWIDGTSEKISCIVENSYEISNIKENINELRQIIPEKAEILNNLETRFEAQEERIERLETKLEQILSTLEEKDDTVLNRKVDKIEKLISKLGANIEKLTSYVDEE